MKIYESGENYLETILMLEKRKGAVRSIDVATELGFSKPSVSVAMKHFRENGYIVMDAEGYITLTEAGKKIAARIYERHQLLTKYLIALGVDTQVAQEDACKLEHDLSEESFARLRAHYEQHLQPEDGAADR